MVVFLFAFDFGVALTHSLPHSLTPSLTLTHSRTCALPPSPGDPVPIPPLSSFASFLPLVGRARGAGAFKDQRPARLSPKALE